MNLGCVGISQRYFGDGKLSAKRFARARLAAQQELEPVQEAYLKRGWDSAAGSSGSVRTILEAQKEMDPKATLITRRRHRGDDRTAGSRGLGAGHPAGVGDRGASHGVCRGARHPRRGLRAAEDQADALERGRDARGPALRHDRSLHARGRARSHGAGPCSSVTTWISRRPRAWSRPHCGCWRRCRKAGSLQDPLAEQALAWASRLHEIGLDVAHSGYHRHGAYLLENADMPGFAREEQLLLARLVGSHRRKLLLEGLDDLIPPWDERALYLILLLRLAVLLHRARSESPIPEVTLVGKPTHAGAALPRPLIPRSSADGGRSQRRSGIPARARPKAARAHVLSV